MKAKFSIKVTQRNMYNFMMYYAYHGVSGIFSIVAAAALLGLAVWSGTHGGENTWLYALFGVLFAVYQPWTLFIHSAKDQTIPIHLGSFYCQDTICEIYIFHLQL